MSGSSSDSGSPVGTSSSFDCASIIERTILNSPNPAVLSSLNVGDILILELASVRGPLYAKHNSEIAGSITSAILAQLIQCINEGYQYIAIIQSITGGRCSVEIRCQNGH